MSVYVRFMATCASIRFCEPPVDAEHAVYAEIHTQSICYVRFITACASATRACASSSLDNVLNVCAVRNNVFICMHAGKHATNSNMFGCIVLVQRPLRFLIFFSCNQVKHVWLHISGTNARYVCLYSLHGRMRFNQPV
jgi:hypothetical protein